MGNRDTGLCLISVRTAQIIRVVAAFDRQIVSNEQETRIAGLPVGAARGKRSIGRLHAWWQYVTLTPKAMPKTAILTRVKGAANLTIFVHHDDRGSKVTVMTKGLSWADRKPADAEAAEKDPK